MRIVFLLAFSIAFAHAQTDQALWYAGTRTPANISTNLTAWWEARFISASDGDAVASWADQNSNVHPATQSTAGSRPTFKTTLLPNGRPAIRFDGGDWLGISATVISRTQTNWTVCYVARALNLSHNNTPFDITEDASTQSILTRQIIIASTFSLESQVRDEASNLNKATYPNDLFQWHIVTSTRNGNTVKLRLDGQWVSTNAANTIGAMDAGAFNTTIGAVRNQSGTPSNWLQGDLYGLAVYASTLTDSQIDLLERYWSQQTQLPLIETVKSTSNPVLPLSGGSIGDSGRILEPSVLLDGGTWKMWYSGLTNNNGGVLGAGWNVLYATSADGISWSKQGIVNANSWECDVIKVGSTYYMVHVKDASFNVRLATSSDGVAWTDKGEMVTLADSVWSDIGPREPCIYEEGGTFYIFYSDRITATGKYGIGLSTCSGDPTVHGNWTCQATPLFVATTTSPRWNDAGETESPCVRKYSFSPHPYIMSFIGASSSIVSAFKPWRPAFAYADSPLGPWTEFRYSPFQSVGVAGAWDDFIQAEMTHVESGGSLYLFYSGGRNGGTNQVGLSTITTNAVNKWLKW